MEETRVFETEFRGFRKSDVLGYIDELRGEHQAERENWETQKASLLEQLATEQEKAVSLGQELAELKAATAENVLFERCEALEQDKTALTLQVEELQQAVAALWKEKSELAAAVAHSTQRLERLQALGREVYKELAVEEEEPQEQAEAPKKKMEQWLF